MMPISHLRVVWTAQVMTKRNKQSGFSLIELLAVTGLMSLFFGITLTLFRTPSARLNKESIQQIGRASRILFKDAVTLRKQLWLMIDLDKQLWYVEEPKIDYIAGTIERVRYTTHEIKKENKLDGTIEFKDVQTSSVGLETLGIVPIAFLPSGFVDPAIIHFEDLENDHEQFSLIIQPLSGFGDYKKGYLELSE